MSIGRQQLHELVEVVDPSELEVLYRVLLKFVPETEPLPDELEAIRTGREQIARGEACRLDEIDWD